MSKSPREATNIIISSMDEGILDPKRVAEMCLLWMSEADVVDMIRAYDMQGLIDDEPEDEPEDDENGNYLWLEYDHDDA